MHKLLLGNGAYVVAPKLKYNRCNLVLIAYIFRIFEQIMKKGCLRN
jgi:hypothetical protein